MRCIFLDKRAIKHINIVEFIKSSKMDSKNIYKPVESILISQPEPTRSPYFSLAEKYGLKIDFRKFIQVEPVDVREFRQFKIKPDEYFAVIFTSKKSIEHFFRICER